MEGFVTGMAPGEARSVSGVSVERFICELAMSMDADQVSHS